MTTSIKGALLRVKMVSKRWHKQHFFYHLNHRKQVTRGWLSLVRFARLACLSGIKADQCSMTLADGMGSLPLNFTYHGDRFVYVDWRRANDVIDHARKWRAYLVDFVAEKVE